MKKPDMQRIRKIVAPIVKGAGYELWGMEFGTNRGKPVLRIYIDAPGGVDLRGVTSVSRLLSPALDVEDPIPFAYSLEVSSPGLDRRIFTYEQYGRLRGSRVNVVMKHPDATGRRRFRGIIKETRDGVVVLDVDGTDMELKYEDIEDGRVIYELPDGLI